MTNLQTKQVFYLEREIHNMLINVIAVILCTMGGILNAFNGDIWLSLIQFVLVVINIPGSIEWLETF